MANLEILICTINEGIRRVPEMFLPEREDVKYLVSWQQTGTVHIDIPSVFTESRKDIRLITLYGRGLAANRNNALKNATGDILLLADDDVKYTDEYFDQILHNFKIYPKADIICFRAIDRDGQFLKDYSDQPFIYAQRPKSTYFSSVEIAFRRKESLPLFDERFGLGSKYLACGEDEVFLHSAFNKGLKIIYLPITVVETESNTTGKRFLTYAAVRRSKGAVLCYMHGALQAKLRCLKFAMSLEDVNFARKMQFYRDMLAGVKYIKDGHL